MSGGFAYVWDIDGEFNTRCNLGMVELERVLSDEDAAELKGLIELHGRYTGSTVARRILNSWDEMLPQFVKVVPTDYKLILEERKARSEQAEPMAVD
jgi:glutamate synthase domain-containing protein 3